MEKITTWIDESDAFILILGGRYGSIEPVSGKSYVQLEYEYVVDKRKPFFALVVTTEQHEQRVRELGLRVDERDNQQRYNEFKSVVTQRLCAFWNDKKDIKAAIFQKLPEWAQKTDLTGWVRADEATNPAVMNELATLSQENREFRANAAARVETIDGLTLDELVRLMREHSLSSPESFAFLNLASATKDVLGRGAANLFELFEIAFESMLNGIYGSRDAASVVSAFVAFGLLSQKDRTNPLQYGLTDAGRKLRNRLLVEGRFRSGATQTSA